LLDADSLNLLLFCLVLLKHLAVLAFLKNFLPVVMQEGSLPAGFPGFTFVRAIFCCFTFHYLPAGAVFIRHYKPLLLSASDKTFIVSLMQTLLVRYKIGGALHILKCSCFPIISAYHSQKTTVGNFSTN